MSAMAAVYRPAYGASRSLRRLAFVLLLIACCIPAAHAQVSASVKGLVTDKSSAAIASGIVTVKNLETGAIRTAATDDSGRYVVLALPVGEYEVRVAKAGFRDAVQSGIHLVVGQEATVDLQLQVGAVSSEILVQGDAHVSACWRAPLDADVLVPA